MKLMIKMAERDTIMALCSDYLLHVTDTPIILHSALYCTRTCTRVVFLALDACREV